MVKSPPCPSQNKSESSSVRASSVSSNSSTVRSVSQSELVAYKSVVDKIIKDKMEQNVDSRRFRQNFPEDDEEDQLVNNQYGRELQQSLANEVRGDIGMMLDCIDVELDDNDEDEINDTFAYMLQELRFDDPLMLIMCVEHDLFARAFIRGFNVEEFNERMAHEVGRIYTVRAVWLKLRELVREVTMNWLLSDPWGTEERESRADIIASIYEHFEEVFDNMSNSGFESLRGRESDSDNSVTNSPNWYRLSGGRALEDWERREGVSSPDYLNLYDNDSQASETEQNVQVELPALPALTVTLTRVSDGSEAERADDSERLQMSGDGLQHMSRERRVVEVSSEEEQELNEMQDEYGLQDENERDQRSELIRGITALKRAGVAVVDRDIPAKRQREQEMSPSHEVLDNVDYQVDQVGGEPNDLLQSDLDMEVPEENSELQAVSQRLGSECRQEQDVSTDEDELIICVGSDEDNLGSN